MAASTIPQPDTTNQPASPATGPTDGATAQAQGAAPAAANAAQPQPQTTAQPQPQTTDPTSTATIAQQPMQSSPTTLVPEKRSGLGGLVDEIRNALSPQTATQVYRDPDTGERFVQRPSRTGGQQWARLASEAMTGAAAGLSAGRGAGNGGAAPLAGMQAQQKQDQQQKQQQSEQQDEDYQIAQQQKVAQANAYLNQVNLATKQFALTRMQAQAGQDDVSFANSQEDREQKLGSVDLGSYSNHVDLADVQKVHPEFWKDATVGNVRSIPIYTADGKPNGVHLYLRQPGVGDQPATPGTQAYRYEPGSKPGEVGSLVPFTPTGTHTIRDIDNFTAAAQGELQKAQTAKAEADQKAAAAQASLAEVPLRNAQTGEAKAATAKNYAEASEAPSVIQKNQAEATKAVNAGAGGAGGAAGSTGDASGLVDQIGTGKIAAKRLDYLMSRNPALLQAVVAKYPDFDSSKAASYPSTFEDFTHGKASQALNAGGVGLRHMEELKNLNTVESHIPGTPAYTAYQNKATTVATELARFYGTETIPGIAAIKDSLSSTLPGNRDAAINTQAKSMGDKLDQYEQTWKNAAPSSAYEAPMPGIGDAAKRARANLDPAYKARYVAELQQQRGQASGSAQRSQPQQASQQPRSAAAAVPAGATNEVHQGGPTGPLIGHMVNGRYVPLAAQ
jgi:hypothetical protein